MDAATHTAAGARTGQHTHTCSHTHTHTCSHTHTHTCRHTHSHIRTQTTPALLAAASLAAAWRAPCCTSLARAAPPRDSALAAARAADAAAPPAPLDPPARHPCHHALFCVRKYTRSVADVLTLRMCVRVCVCKRVCVCVCESRVQAGHVIYPFQHPVFDCTASPCVRCLCGPLLCLPCSEPPLRGLRTTS